MKNQLGYGGTWETKHDCDYSDVFSPLCALCVMFNWY